MSEGQLSCVVVLAVCFVMGLWMVLCPRDWL
jgi:hypothetical protein